MGTYVPNSKREQDEMVRAAGYKDIDDLFSCIPEGVKLGRELNLPSGMGELKVAAEMERMADANKVFKHIFRGAGAYNHYIPAIVKSVTGKEEFITAYTPYQAEISQGILQTIFEYQTAICELTGMDVSNASVYDVGTAAGEAITMCKDRKHSNAYVASTVQPGVYDAMKTYCFGSNTKIEQVAAKDGTTDLDALKAALEADPAAAMFYVQQPNYFGLFEDVEAIAEIVHAAGAKLVVGVNPIALGIMKTPADMGADIAVGEGQPLGLPLAYGGPYIGFMACRDKLVRSLPGRIVGETKDHDGERAFVLTLQAREQHIRREKASSNICSNEALCALTVCVYLAAIGPDGLKEVASQCMSKAHYLKDKLAEVGLKPAYDKEFFHEFVTECPCDANALAKALEEKGFLAGLPLDEKHILWCATEMNTKEEIDELAAVIAELGKEG